MKSVSVQDYRCFRDEQTVKIAPLTLLVGDNSTGKSSLLAMIRALWDAAYAGGSSFDQEPFALGSFDDIVHYRGGPVSRPTAFRGQLVDTIVEDDAGCIEIDVEFAKIHDYPAVRSKQFLKDGYGIRFGPSDSGVWLITPSQELPCELPAWKQPDDMDVGMWGLFRNVMVFPETEEIRHGKGIETLAPPQREALIDTIEVFRKQTFQELDRKKRPRAIAPLRARPQRTYDIGPSYWDPGGESMPNLLMALHRNDPERWTELKALLESYGRKLGLFSQLEVHPVRRGSGVGPFQLRVRDALQGKQVGPWRNLMDVGYGVSQILPLMIQLLEPGPSVYLLQQPEIHLHPRAQAALGTLLCEQLVASPAHKLIIETHSNYLLDRIRMEVRDDAVAITPDDVSVAFFESRGLDVEIHNIVFDPQGNVDAPPSYANFFMQEVYRSIG